MAPRIAAKTDRNHADIRDGLRRMGFVAIDTFRLGYGKPDLIVVGDSRRTGLQEMTWWEIKAPGGGFTEEEQKFHARYGEHCRTIQVARRIEDVLDWYGWDVGGGRG